MARLLSVLVLLGLALATTAAGGRGLLESDTLVEEEVLVELLMPDAIIALAEDCPSKLTQARVEIVEEVAHSFFEYGYCTLSVEEQYEQLASRLKYSFSKQLQAYLINSGDGEVDDACDFRKQVEDQIKNVKDSFDGESFCGDMLGGAALHGGAPAPAPAISQ